MKADKVKAQRITIRCTDEEFDLITRWLSSPERAAAITMVAAARIMEELDAEARRRMLEPKRRESAP